MNIHQPFADKYRPATLEDIAGQKHLLGEDGIIPKLVKSGSVPNMILYGPPGTGKTTLATIIANELQIDCVKLNAIDVGVKEIRAAMSKHKDGVVLYIDEFHLLNKKQQQEFLEATERGSAILIASTTENPYFSIYKAILSRSSVFEFKPVDQEDIVERLKAVVSMVEKDYCTAINFEPGALEFMSDLSNGDVRSAINALEMAFRFKYKENESMEITVSDVKKSNPSRAFDWDNSGDSKYDTLSAFHKSLRGSDVDASLYYLARLLKGGDLQGLCRRILCVASEDIGMADSNALVFTKACVDTALQLGMPEARLPLAHAVIYLATAPKSNSVVIAIDGALSDVETKYASAIPAHLRDAHYGGAKALDRGIGYKYPHNYPHNWVKQDYMPVSLNGHTYYKPQDNEIEKKLDDFWKKIKIE